MEVLYFIIGLTVLGLLSPARHVLSRGQRRFAWLAVLVAAVIVAINEPT